MMIFQNNYMTVRNILLRIAHSALWDSTLQPVLRIRIQNWPFKLNRSLLLKSIIVTFMLIGVKRYRRNKFVISVFGPVRKCWIQWTAFRIRQFSADPTRSGTSQTFQIQHSSFLIIEYSAQCRYKKNGHWKLQLTAAYKNALLTANSKRCHVEECSLRQTG